MEEVFQMEFAGRTLTVETGKLAKQASGAALVRYGDTAVLVTATGSKEPRPDADFFPLTVDYEEKMYSVGKIPGGFIKREGRPPESATLFARLIDRPIRPLFPKTYRYDVHAFPDDLLHLFTEKTGHSYIGNEIASGTEIIERLGPDHFRTGAPIIYTSADSVFQIAAHMDVISLDELYRICEITRNEVCVGPYEVGRIIARPFVGTPGHFVRTGDRRDYSRMPERKMVFEYLSEHGFLVDGIGKIGDIYAHGLPGYGLRYDTPYERPDAPAQRRPAGF